MKIGLFYGTNTGVTELVSEQLRDKMEEVGFEVTMFDIADDSIEKFDDFESFIIATPTWNDGELQDDWEEIIDDYNDYNFSGKKVGFMGLGDQEAYCDNYLDAIGKMAKPVRDSGGIIFGRWSSEGYSHTESVGQDEDGMWVGLALDNDNQEEMTEQRIVQWVNQIKNELKI